MPKDSFKVNTFIEYLTERVRESYLYHNTGSSGFEGIMKSNALAVSRNKGNTISFSRSPNYKGTHSSVVARFVFDRNTLARTKKIRPHADLSVQKGTKFVTGSNARWESEERVSGPIYLDKRFGLVEIQILKSYADTIKKSIELYKGFIEFARSQQIPMLEKGMFWNQITKDWKEITTNKQKRLHNKKSIEDQIRSYQKEIEEKENLIHHPMIKIVSSLREGP